MYILLNQYEQLVLERMKKLTVGMRIRVIGPGIRNAIFAVAETGYKNAADPRTYFVRIRQLSNNREAEMRFTDVRGGTWGYVVVAADVT